MGVIAAAVLEYPADQCDEGQSGTDEHDPESDGESEETPGTCQAEDQRPPAPGAEVSLLAGTFMDFGVFAVLGAEANPLTREAKVGADHACEAADQEDTEDTYPFRPVGEEPVGQGYRYEEEDSCSEEP
jgi:hypothetical protein